MGAAISKNRAWTNLVSTLKLCAKIYCRACRQTAIAYLMARTEERGATNPRTNHPCDQLPQYIKSKMFHVEHLFKAQKRYGCIRLSESTLSTKLSLRGVKMTAALYLSKHICMYSYSKVSHRIRPHPNSSQPLPRQ